MSRILLAEGFLFGSERQAIIAIAVGVAIFLFGLLIAYALPWPRPAHCFSEGGVFAPLMFAAMFLLLPFSLAGFRFSFLPPETLLIIISVLVALPFCIWRLHRSLRCVPSELKDAARIDGCSPGHVFRYAVLPVISRSLVVAAICSLVAAWTLCMVIPDLLRADGFEPSHTTILAAPVAVLFLFLTVYLVHTRKAAALDS
jgi:ABC-type glycerol-3-phosphate transport system permease component